MKDWWAHIYQYEIGFRDIIIKQADLDIKETELVKKFGQARYIKLVPQNKDFKFIHVSIPEGAIPIYRRRDRIAISKASPGMSMRFLVGYELMEVRNLIMIDSKTGSVDLITEKAPGSR